MRLTTPQKLKFPYEDQNQYQGKIKFTLYENIAPRVSSKSNLHKQNQNSSDNIGEQNSFLDTLGTAYEAVAGSTFAGGGNSANTNKTVTMYMPAGVQITDAVQFDNANLGMKGASVEAGLRGGEFSAAGAAARMMNPIGEINAVRNAIAGDASGGLTRTLAAAAAQKFGGGATNAVVRSGLQVAVNPNTRSVFQGVPLREFNFTFKMLPLSHDENMEIHKIIKFFRSELYPESIGAGAVSVGYEFPNQFLIHSSYKNKQRGPQFLPCYLRSISTSYNATSASFYSDGLFSEVDLSLTFVEVRAMTKADVQRGITATGRTRYESWDDFINGGIENIVEDFIEGQVSNLVNRIFN